MSALAAILTDLAAVGIDVSDIDASEETERRNVALYQHAKSIGFCLVCCAAPAVSNDGERCETCDSNFQEDNHARI